MAQSVGHVGTSGPLILKPQRCPKICRLYTNCESNLTQVGHIATSA
jgi:hypothetical protein